MAAKDAARWMWFPIRAVARFIARSGKRIAVTILGFLLLIAGVIMLVTPGPGWAAIFLGLAVLATEYVWAERMLNAAKAKAQAAKQKVVAKRDQRRQRKAQHRAAPTEPAD